MTLLKLSSCLIKELEKLTHPSELASKFQLSQIGQTARSYSMQMFIDVSQDRDKRENSHTQKSRSELPSGIPEKLVSQFQCHLKRNWVEKPVESFLASQIVQTTLFYAPSVPYIDFRTKFKRLDLIFCLYICVLHKLWASYRRVLPVLFLYAQFLALVILHKYLLHKRTNEDWIWTLFHRSHFLQS